VRDRRQRRRAARPRPASFWLTAQNASRESAEASDEDLDARGFTMEDRASQLFAAGLRSVLRPRFRVAGRRESGDDVVAGEHGALGLDHDQSWALGGGAESRPQCSTAAGNDQAHAGTAVRRAPLQSW